MDFFSNIGLVTSGFTLIAFLAAVLATVTARQVNQKQKALASLPDQDRLRAYELLLIEIGVDVNTLNENQKYEFALRELASRDSKRELIAKVLYRVCVLFFFLAAIAITIGNREPTYEPVVIGRVLNSVTNRAIESAEITISGHSFHTFSDATGNFTAKLGTRVTQGSYITLTVTKDGYIAATKTILVNSGSIATNRILMTQIKGG